MLPGGTGPCRSGDGASGPLLGEVGLLAPIVFGSAQRRPRDGARRSEDPGRGGGAIPVRIAGCRVRLHAGRLQARLGVRPCSGHPDTDRDTCDRGPAYAGPIALTHLFAAFYEIVARVVSWVSPHHESLVSAAHEVFRSAGATSTLTRSAVAGTVPLPPTEKSGAFSAKRPPGWIAACPCWIVRIRFRRDRFSPRARLSHLLC